MAFKRTIENFVCEHCNTAVRGTGYTNHCPKCLWSKHVDVDPGDRSAVCGGLMQPVRVEGTVAEYVIVHRCRGCGLERRNKVSGADDPAALIAIAKGAGGGIIAS